jgi:hypothetical protein
MIMSNNRNNDKDAYTASLFAALSTVILVIFYFLVESNIKDLAWKGFLQGLSINILSVTFPFLILYIFITRANIFENSSNSSYQQIFARIDERIARLKDEILSNIDSFYNKVAGEIDTRIDLDINSSFESFKDTIATEMKQMSKQIGKEVNTKLDLDSNELYSFYGLRSAKIGNISITTGKE